MHVDWRFHSFLFVCETTIKWYHFFLFFISKCFDLKRLFYLQPKIVHSNDCSCYARLTHVTHINLPFNDIVDFLAIRPAHHISNCAFRWSQRWKYTQIDNNNNKSIISFELLAVGLNRDELFRRCAHVPVGRLFQNIKLILIFVASKWSIKLSGWHVIVKTMPQFGCENEIVKMRSGKHFLILMLLISFRPFWTLFHIWIKWKKNYILSHRQIAQFCLYKIEVGRKNMNSQSLKDSCVLLINSMVRSLHRNAFIDLSFQWQQRIQETRELHAKSCYGFNLPESSRLCYTWKKTDTEPMSCV